MSAHYDLTLLPPAEFEFVVLADTHYMLDPGDAPVEFEGRRKQSARVGHALELIASLNPEFVIHLGDLTQEPPESGGLAAAWAEAQAQLDRLKSAWFQVVGNHEVGDKPDATMPTHPVRRDILGAYHKEMGPSWQSFDHGECSFIILNSQILNTGLPEEHKQRSWIERRLEEVKGRRIFLFLHLPLFLYHEKEPSTGHYDNVGEPARSWLLDLVKQFRVELVASGHVHFQFLNRLGPTRLLTLVSTSFTRPGFAHMFTSAPPPEQGRDDTDKLGFYLFRVLPDRVDVHLLRTFGATEKPREGGRMRRLVTQVSPTLKGSPLGLTLRHPITNVVEIPIVFPSTVRQRVRNDYPLLSCLEMGARSLRIPWTDLRSEDQWVRLSILREAGLAIYAFLFEDDVAELAGLVEQFGVQVSGWEIQLAGATVPSAETMACLEALQSTDEVEFSLCPVVPEETVTGKQLPRTRFGYRLEELGEIDGILESRGLRIANVCCRIVLGENPWDLMVAARNLEKLRRIGSLDFLVELGSLDDDRNSYRTAEALFAAALLPGTRVFFDPLVDIDRTMDVSHGILDTLCNPRPVFHALRCLNTILYGGDLGKTREVDEFKSDGARSLQIVVENRKWVLLLPGNSDAGSVHPADSATSLLNSEGTLDFYLLNQAMVLRDANRNDLAQVGAELDASGPCLVVVEFEL